MTQTETHAVSKSIFNVAYLKRLRWKIMYIESKDTLHVCKQKTM